MVNLTAFNPVALAGDLAEMGFRSLESLIYWQVSMRRIWSEAGGASPWEMHPDCDEMLQIFEGSIEVEILPEDGSVALKKVVSEGEYIVIPQGCWHRQTMPARTVEHYLTPGKTLHSSDGDPR
jgi:mannose-6-phosphate isomerase-like protein (cupin superfamily)